MVGPYKENRKKDIIDRTFSENVDDLDLIWHKDRENRMITVLEGNNWYIQMENKLPVLLEKNKQYFIPKEEFHRIIKGDGNLKLHIQERINNNKVHRGKLK